MKTGGTLNFLKRAGAILMLLAIFASSCNKYADDFKQINTKLDALITSVAGVSTLSTGLTTLAGQVTALQTAVAGLATSASITALQTSLTAITGKINDITTTLNNVATAGTATKGVVDQLKIDLANLATTVDGNNTTLLENIATLQASLDGIALTGSATDTATALTIQGLQLLLNAQKTILDQILASVNMYNGDVTITTVAEMRFFYGKLSQMGIINGSVIINTTNLTEKLDTVNMITSKITAVIGTKGSGEGNSVAVTSVADATVLDLSHLVSVSGAYTVGGVDISDDSLASVGGYFGVNYDGAYSFPNLRSVGLDLYIVDYPVTGTYTGTTSINFSGITSVGTTTKIHDDGLLGSHSAGVLIYPKALTINISGKIPFTSLTAAIAASITLGTEAIGGLTITAVSCTALNLPNATSCATAANITTKSGCVVDLSKLATSVGLLTINGPTTLTLDKLASGSLKSTTAETVSLAIHNWAVPADLSAVTNLTLGRIANPVWAGNYATLESLAVTGVATTGWAGLVNNTVTTSVSNTALVSVTLGGNLSSATIQNNAKLTALTTTTGVVNSLYIDNNDLLTNVTLAHSHYEGGPGSDLVVTNNAILASLVTSTDKMKSLKVTGNASLTSLIMSSYVLAVNSTNNVSIEIGANKLTGTYTAPTLATATTLLVEATVVSPDLLTISGYVKTLAAKTGMNLTVTADLYDSNGSADGTTALSVAMVGPYTNQWGTSKVDAIGGINSATEFTLVQ